MVVGVFRNLLCILQRSHGEKAYPLILVQKGCKICSEFGAFEELIPDQAADARGGFPRLTLDLMNESETRAQSVRAVVRDGLSDLDRTLINVLNWYYLVHKSDPQGFGCI